MKLLPTQIKHIMPSATISDTGKYLPWLNEWMPKYGITTIPRIRHFLSQVAHESGQLRYVKEMASGAAYDTGRLAKILGNTLEKDGDGQKYKGRGLIQITGRNNYSALGKDWGIDVMSDPSILELPEYVIRSACWFWWKKGLNRLSDKGATVRQVTRKVNGGQNGLAEREEFYRRACEAIK
jgi:putative chitinase